MTVAELRSLKAGSKIPEDLVHLAVEANVRCAKVEAIGGVSELNLAYYNHETKKYEEHSFREFMEVTSLLGNVTQSDGKPFLHVHGTLARRDLSVVAGHVVSATVFPLLEVVVTPTKNIAVRRGAEELGLKVIYK